MPRSPACFLATSPRGIQHLNRDKAHHRRAAAVRTQRIEVGVAADLESIYPIHQLVEVFAVRNAGYGVSEGFEDGAIGLSRQAIIQPPALDVEAPHRLGRGQIAVDDIVALTCECIGGVNGPSLRQGQ
jgi:hypothetical protein